MDEPQALPPIGADVTHLVDGGSGGGSLPPIGSDVTHLIQPDFKTTAVTPSLFDLGTELVKGFGAQMNPLPLLKAMYDRTASEFDRALTAGKAGHYGEALARAAALPTAPGSAVIDGLADAHVAQFKKAYEAFQQGRLSEALGHTLAGVVPVVGPPAANVGEEIGTGDPRTIAHGIGGATALLAPAALKYGTEVARTGSMAPSAAAVAAAPAAAVRVPGLASSANPVEAAAVDFGLERGIPVDAGTATGNAAVKAAQHLADRSLGGSAIAKTAAQAQAEALTRVGGDLAADVRPTAVMPEQAGQTIRDALTSKIQAHRDLADAAYDRLRALEEKPENRMDMPVAPAPVDALKSWQAAQLRRIVHELDASGYVKRTINRDTQGMGGDAEVTPSSGGAQVFHDIRERMSGGANPSRGLMQQQLEEYLGGGDETPVVAAALDVAKERVMGRRTVSTPELPASAMDTPTRLEGTRVRSQEMGLPVDVSSAKEALQSVYDQMKRQMPLTQQQANPGLKSLQNILEGPDWAPLSQVDRDLSVIKSLARDKGGLAKVAVSKLDTAVRTAASNGTPDVWESLQQGRRATAAKHETAAVLDAFHDEPVKAFRQVIAPKDTGVELLRTIEDHVPQALPQISRAWLEDALQTATGEGGFNRAAKLARDWENLGPETKRILYGGTRPDLDKFFLLAKKMAESPNPSGTGHLVALSGQASAVGSAAVLTLANPTAGAAALGAQAVFQIGAAGLSKILHSPAAVQALTRGFNINVQNYPAAATAFAQIMKAAGDDVLRVPQAAGLVKPGNIDLNSRPIVKNADGTVSTVRSISFEDRGREVLIPTVSDDGRVLSDAAAIALYRKTGKHLGIFDTPAHATAYATKLHEDQARLVEGKAEQ